MAAAVGDNERRWVIVGICLNKVLTPALREVLGNEIPKWYQSLLPPPHEIDKQIFGRHEKNLAPSTLKLNYENINNNRTNHKPFVNKYDYAVKDAVSLAKLFVKPFMANFSGFDDTMDTSAALSLVAEAQPFHASGAGGMAKKIRSDIRNEWAHCDFAHWTDVVYQAALKDMETLINRVNLTPVDKKKTLDDLDGWKKKGLDLCFGPPVDSELLKLVKTEVAELRDSLKDWKNDAVSEQSKFLNALEGIEKSFTPKINELKKDVEPKINELKKDVEELKVGQLALYDSFSRKHKEPPCLFMAPKQSMWFSGRESELTSLRDILDNESESVHEKVTVIAVSGLGGSGKTSLAGEYIYKWRDYYKGGMFWISGEDDVKLKASFDDIAAQFNTLDNDSLDATLSKTLAVFSRISRPWLMVIDDMDGPSLSQNLRKLISGSWQSNTKGLGRIIITTRRTPRELNQDISGFRESSCLKLDSFGCEDAKNFVFKRTGISRDEMADENADLLYENLGGLPLALEQACAYIVSLGCTLSEYLEAYQKQSLKLLDKEKASSPHGTSLERLAVRTTWSLNFEHVRKHENGIIATRFLNASAFLDRNEIQKDLINVGEPRVDDKVYCDHVNSALGSLEVLKLLTDFSFFKKTHDSSLTVHRLVQEVIRESLTSEKKVESIVDAARLLRFAFSQCPSPDKISESVATEYGDRPSLYLNDSSKFYKWHKLCLHAHEIRRNLERLLEVVHDVTGKTVFLPEIARVVYQCALHLNVNNLSRQAKIIGDFANRILDCCRQEISENGLRVLFPHTFPLSESVRRLIKYSCEAPPEIEKINTIFINTIKTSAYDPMKAEIDNLRSEGNDLFMKSNFEEAVTVYSSCIDRSIGKNFFDPRLFSNRASAYLRLEQFKNALSDAEEYIKYSPDCWKGYARKALALHGLNEQDAVCAAALAFYYHPSIFEKYEPFKTSFPNMKERIHICDDVPSLVSLLSAPLHDGMLVDSMCKIILLKPGKYCLLAKDFESFRIQDENIFNLNIKRLITLDFCIVGLGDSSPSLSFERNLGLLSRNVVAYNISFIFDVANWGTMQDSTVKLLNCSYTCNHAFVSKGYLSVKNCLFNNCKNTALFIEGEAVVEDSVFSGNKLAGIEIFGGSLCLKNSKLHGNRWGLLLKHGKCRMTCCQVYDNEKMGIWVQKGNATFTRNEIFHNDCHGVFVHKKGSAVIEENEIFENNWLGIRAFNAWCHISRNRMYQNKCGGIHVMPVTKASGLQQSIIESNHIFRNEGPGIDHAIGFEDELDSAMPNLEVFSARVAGEFMLAKCTDNELKNNMETGSHPPLKEFTDICFRCYKKGHWKKCDNCFIAGYCSPECEKDDFEIHKNCCVRLLERYSVLVKVLPLSSGLIGDKMVLDDGNERGMPWSVLEPCGRAHARPPNNGERFVVKIQACDGPRKSNRGRTLLSIRDRSLSVNGSLAMGDHCDGIYRIVRECGFNCECLGWKKKFFWAVLAGDYRTVRVFLTDLPSYQLW